MGLRGTTLRLATGDSERLRIDDGGRIGIGTTPNSNISVYFSKISRRTRYAPGNATSIQIGHNFYWNGSAFKYLGQVKLVDLSTTGEIVFKLLMIWCYR